MTKYIWQNDDWPDFTWDNDKLILLLGEARKAQGKILAQAEFIGLEAKADIIVEEAFSTAAIEGEKLDRNSIRSSVAKRLGLPTAGLPQDTRPIDGLVEMLLDATTNYEQPLTSKRLHGWHAALFPTGYSGMQKISVGKWRVGTEPMQVVSGHFDKVQVHFEAPPSSTVPKEMKTFLNWWKNPSKNLDGIIRAGVAHFWFVTIHPFDDGNGRISRAITDMAIAQDESSSRRLYSLSSQIVKERDDYYDALNFSQKEGCDITSWLEWFLGVFTRSITSTEKIVEKTVRIANFWKNIREVDLNTRQKKAIALMLEKEPEGFIGGMNNRKYVSLTKTSRQTAKRDLSDLLDKGILVKNPGEGRSVNYSLNKKLK